jgi:hypothetical protein
MVNKQEEGNLKISKFSNNGILLILIAETKCNSIEVISPLLQVSKILCTAVGGRTG